MLRVHNVHTLYGRSRYVYMLHILIIAKVVCTYCNNLYGRSYVHIPHIFIVAKVMCTYCKNSLLQKLLCAHTTYALYGKSRCAHNARTHYCKSYVHILHILFMTKVVMCRPHILIIANIMCTYRTVMRTYCI